MDHRLGRNIKVWLLPFWLRYNINYGQHGWSWNLPWRPWYDNSTFYDDHSMIVSCFMITMTSMPRYTHDHVMVSTKHHVHAMTHTMIVRVDNGCQPRVPKFFVVKLYFSLYFYKVKSKELKTWNVDSIGLMRADSFSCGRVFSVALEVMKKLKILGLFHILGRKIINRLKKLYFASFRYVGSEVLDWTKKYLATIEKINKNFDFESQKNQRFFAFNAAKRWTGAV